MKILVVDDFDISRLFIKNMLNELGYENTFEVSNGYSALASLKSKIFDCVITEWEMTEMSGLELLKKIRADELLKNIPVLITTEDGLTDSVVLASKAGASGFLLKPLKKEDFSKSLIEVMKNYNLQKKN